MRRVVLACLAAAAAAACSDTTAPSVPSAPSLISVRVDTVTVGAFLDLTLSEPSTVEVTYSSEPGDPALTISQDFHSDEGSLALTRLAPDRLYTYSAVPIAADGARGLPITGTFRTPPLPADLQSVQLTPAGTPSEALTMLEVIGKQGFTGFVAVDARGQVVWRWRTLGAPQGWTRRASGSFVLDDLGNGLSEVSPDGTLLHTLAFDFFGPTPHHDVIATPQNTLLFISQDFRTPDGMPTTWGEAIYEWSPESGAVIKRWTAWDWYDPHVDWSDVSTPLDWLHANSLAIGPHGNILLSLNWLSEIISISPDWSKIEWRLGGTKSTFAVTPDAQFSGQHSATMPVEGHVLMMDNGRERADGPQYSRALEVVLDTVAKTARTVWEFRPPTTIFAPYVGLTRRLANGNTTVFFGLPAGLRGATGPVASYEVTPDGSIRWSLIIGNVTSVYRGAPMESVGSERPAP